MLKLPTDIDERVRFYTALALLEATGPYQAVKEAVLEPTLAYLRQANDRAQGRDIYWNQGACQLLSELLTIAGKAQDTLRKLRR